MEPGQKYPEEVRHFCISLLAHSPRAREIVRRTFHNLSPNSLKIQPWFSNSDIRGEPGNSVETLDRLKKFAADYGTKNGRNLMTSLVFDEFYVKRQLFWPQNEFQYPEWKSYGEKPGNYGRSIR